MFHLIGLVISFFIGLFLLNVGLAVIQAIFGTFTGYDPDKRMRDDEDRYRRQEHYDDYD